MSDIPLLGRRWRDLPLIISTAELNFFFNGLIPNRGRGPIGICVEKIIKKPNAQNTGDIITAGEVAMVRDFRIMNAFFIHSSILNPIQLLAIIN